MRLWSLHPSYLDTKGLVACWREGLLARKVLLGETRGYRNHPQLHRFKTQLDSISAIDQYLSFVLKEAQRRGFAFNPAKIGPYCPSITIPITDGQLMYEFGLLKAKLFKRDIEQYRKLAQVTSPQPNPIFKIVEGGIEAWEKVPGS